MIEAIRSGDVVWANWVDDLPSQHKVIRVMLDHIILSVDGNDKPVPISRISKERPYVSDDNFEDWWNMNLGSVSECFYWLGWNAGLVDMEGVATPSDLIQAVKQARYKYHTGRQWSEYEYK